MRRPGRRGERASRISALAGLPLTFTALASGCTAPAPSDLLRPGDDAPPLAVSTAVVSRALAPPPATLFVDFAGATIRKSGASDASRNLSSVCGATIAPFDHRPFGNDRAQVKDRIIADLARYYAGLDLAIVSSRPTEGPYHMLVVGGTPKDCGLDGFFGLSPLDCGNRSAADISFAFSEAISAVEGVALVGAHEVGHALGLPHVLEGCDVMSNFTCVAGGRKRFLDQDMEIAPDHRGRCGGGRTANSRALLRASLGTRAGAADASADMPLSVGDGHVDRLRPGGERPSAGGGCALAGGGARFWPPGLLLFFLYWWGRRRRGHHERDAIRGENLRRSPEIQGARDGYLG